jgi:preprotein translocase subunit SecG
MVTLITVFHVLACLFLILVVLLQAGKGGGMGTALGGQTSAQVFGGRGAGTFLERLTAGTAVVFMLTSMTLAYFASQSDSARLQKMAVQKAEQKKKDDVKAADDKARKDAEDRAAKDKAAGDSAPKSDAPDTTHPDTTKIDTTGEAPKPDTKTDVEKK